MKEKAWRTTNLLLRASNTLIRTKSDEQKVMKENKKSFKHARRHAKATT